MNAAERVRADLATGLMPARQVLNSLTFDVGVPLTVENAPRVWIVWDPGEGGMVWEQTSPGLWDGGGCMFNPQSTRELVKAAVVVIAWAPWQPPKVPA